jgi:hypothetical protein
MKTRRKGHAFFLLHRCRGSEPFTDWDLNNEMAEKEANYSTRSIYSESVSQRYLQSMRHIILKLRIRLSSRIGELQNSCNISVPLVEDHHRRRARDEQRSARQEIAVRTISIVNSPRSRMFSFAIGCQKLGQPVPESYFVLD